MFDLDIVSWYVFWIRKEFLKLKEYVKKLFMFYDGLLVFLEYSYIDWLLNKYMMC